MKTADRSYSSWLFKYLWLLVIVPKAICSLLVFSFGLFLLLKVRTFKIDSFVRIVFALLVVYTVAVFLRIVESQSLTSVPATINTMLMWFFGIVFYCSFMQEDINYERIGRYCFVNLNILLIISIAFLLKDHLYFLERLSIFGNKLYNEPSWTNEGLKYRLFGFMEYPTNVATFYCINAGASLGYVFEKHKSILIRIAYSVVIALPVYLSDTRSGIIATLIVVLAVVFFSIENRNYRKMFVLIGIMVIIPVAFLLSSKIEHIFVTMLDSRQGSSSTRIRLYVTTIQKVVTESPIVGMGIKYPNPYVFGLPYGSHSTYIGIFYRTGIVGVLFFVIMFWRITKKSIFLVIDSAKYRFLGIVMLAYFVAIVFLDIDASAWVLAMFFTNVAMISKISTIEVSLR